MVFRVIYEASRNLGSPPPPRTDRVEACRPRGCLLLQCSEPAYPCRGLPGGGTGSAMGGLTKATRSRATFEEPSPFDPRAPRLGWRGLTPRWPRSLAARFRV